MATVAELATGGAVDLWLDDPSDVWEVFDAMRAAGVADVRRVGAICASPEPVAVARAAGLGAIVGVGALAHAAPDVVVAPGELGQVVAERWGRGRLVLLNPGLALTTDAVKRAAAGPDLCHREPEYRRLDRRLREKVRRLAGVSREWELALLSGSGTAANEASLRAAVRPGRRLLVVVNGVYGERLRESARRAGIETVSVEGPWTEPIDATAVEAALAVEADLDALAVVHHETTTGLLNPLPELAAAAAAAGVCGFVDAISSFGVEELELG